MYIEKYLSWCYCIQQNLKFSFPYAQHIFEFIHDIFLEAGEGLEIYIKTINLFDLEGSSYILRLDLPFPHREYYNFCCIILIY